jgi:hypothetical protein
VGSYTFSHSKHEEAGGRCDSIPFRDVVSSQLGSIILLLRESAVDKNDNTKGVVEPATSPSGPSLNIRFFDIVDEMMIRCTSPSAPFVGGVKTILMCM